MGAEYLAQLEGERDYLREQLKAVAAERDTYRAILLREERAYFARHEREIEAEIREAMKTGIDARDVLREIETLLQEGQATT